MIFEDLKQYEAAEEEETVRVPREGEERRRGGTREKSAKEVKRWKGRGGGKKGEGGAGAELPAALGAVDVRASIQPGTVATVEKKIGHICCFCSPHS